MNPLATWALRAVAVVAFLAAIVMAYNAWYGRAFKAGQVDGRGEVQSRWDQDKIRVQGETLREVAIARKQEKDAAELAAKNLKVEYENQKVQAVAVARSAGVASGMSRSIASLNADALGRGLPTVSSCPAEFVRERDAAIFARTALDQCSGKYRDLAEVADGLALKLDTAAKYIAVVTPATQ